MAEEGCTIGIGTVNWVLYISDSIRRTVKNLFQKGCNPTPQCNGSRTPISFATNAGEKKTQSLE